MREKITKMNKRGFQFTFAWMFAIIVGAVVIFLAFYISQKIIATQTTVSGTEAGLELSTILTPLENVLDEGRAASIKLNQETRVFNGCRRPQDLPGTEFGFQELSASLKSGVSGWGSPGLPSRFKNKYLFSKATVEGEEYVVLSKSFAFPFKIASIMILWSADEKYCFINAPSDVENEIQELNPKGVYIEAPGAECPANAKRVCFGSGVGADCNIQVNEYAKTITHITDFDGARVGYQGSLMYAAIFSDPSIYECQTERLMARAHELAEVYIEKTGLLATRGCAFQTVAPSLNSYVIKTQAYVLEEIEEGQSINLEPIAQDVREIERANRALRCELF